MCTPTRTNAERISQGCKTLKLGNTDEMLFKLPCV